MTASSIYSNGPYSGGTLGQLIFGAVDRFGDRPAISDGDEVWSYAELGSRIERYAAVLRNLGLARGDGIAVLTGNRAQAWAVICAALTLGLRYTPVHPLAAAEEQINISRDSEARALVVDAAKYADNGRTISASIDSIEFFLSLGPIEGALDIEAASVQAAPFRCVDSADSEDIAWLSYTGGTTGRSKGVMLSHRAMLNCAVLSAAEWEWPKGLRLLLVTPISHAAGVIMYPAMLLGGYTRLLSGFDAEAYCQVIAAERITATFVVPTIITALLDSTEARALFDTGSLEMMIYGAAPIAPSRLAEAIATFGPIMQQLYGQTEVPNAICTMRPVDHDASIATRLESCGKPTGLVTLRLLDPDGNEVETGNPGEMCIRSPLIMSGYWRQPELTAEALRGGWLHTGDVAIKDEKGYFYIVDRLKDMIVSGGFNIYPREVENALEKHPAVDQAAVIGIPDRKWGEAVAAFVVMRHGCSLEITELQEHVRSLLGGPWAPKSITFQDALPLTGLGKIDRKALRAPYWADRHRAVG